MAHVAHDTSEKEIAPPNTGAIWKTFWILLVLTAIEFVIAFTMPANTLRVAIFCGMTIVKAFYIVGEFMHLKHEVKSLIWMILVPTLFVVWLLVALIYEGGNMY
ncbi:cytochrome C oxidase subunit IV family protein [Aquirufa sp.]|jgi:cytochrome c oxidase subunit 4|uniref:cytochrome C oxidase subunit IV family protein n=1 Tax=Aquirufa sp. TaxID=2676249 RepID=UPI0037C14D3B